MEFRQTETSLGGEVEYLAALFAFRDQVLDAEQLQLAIARLVSGQSPSMLEAIRSLEVVEPVRLAAAVKMAQLYCNMNGSDIHPRRLRHDGVGNNHTARLQHRQLQSDPDETIEFEDAPEPAAVPAGPEYEWQQTSDWVSHFYYVEDSLRAYTGGRLGIVSSIALFVCLIAIIWGAIQYQFTSNESENNRVRNGTSSEAIGGLDLDELSNVEIESSEPAAQEVVDDTASENDDSDVGEPVSTPNKEVVAPDKESTDGWLSIPLSPVPNELDGKSPTPAPEITNLPRSGRLIEDELTVAMTEISSGDLASARTRLTRIFNAKADGLDLSSDLRWLHLGIGVMLEQDTADSIQAASFWLRKIQEKNDPVTHLLFARWLTQSTATHKSEMSDYFSTLQNPNATLQNWLQAASGNHTQTIPRLEAELKKPDANRLNRFFLALAYWVANRPPEVIAQLDQLQANTPTSTQSTNADTQWLTDVSWKTISATASNLRAKATPKK